ncbi:MAG: sigma-54 dependent transcriptional regulator [Candidatus Eisenbacteria bacterium]|uniref:Sigma-54 dependent transcriptional regulator n=1 Tax=Eiseniibacteriota bacterium TaxID=2212470 RepID=A0A948S140_UNCEI|nr:sigma-54 dependent transcriptional regulator [Candidatus Eisenbacteria bacterium]MBU1947911.1 sigma-54 dependent transcriptional regulator [Candidatus Eisenbacteria bacterium]MBU2691909.1 sigma-54 dependent transcriptional regulator [Candidatus Eisenbacteria bacterium]
MAVILIVDDEAGIRAFIAEALAEEGYLTVEAADGSAAVEKLRRRGFDLVLTDLRMPGPVDGMALVRMLRAEQPDVEIIVLTAHGTVDSAVEAMKLGAFDYLQKPVSSPGQLRMVVSRALERRRLLAIRDRTSREISALPPLFYSDPAMQPVVRAVEKVAPTASTVLILGDSGTGKEIVARTLHRLSARRDGPFVPINCAAISESLMESEIFGHEKGAFTGATAARRGRLELADGGTLFLDEIGELKASLQSKLLRVIEDGRFERVGGTRTLQADVRWIAATNRDIEAMVASGAFREDLYHRLAVFPIRLPALRERPADIVPLAEGLLARIAAEMGRPGLRLSDDARARIRSAYWPGNIRSLANALERAAILAEGDTIEGKSVVPSTPNPKRGSDGVRTMAEIEAEAIRRALDDMDGNRRLAAERLGIGLRTLYEKLKRHGIS